MTTPTPQAQMDEILRLATEYFPDFSERNKHGISARVFFVDIEQLSAFARKVAESEREAIMAIPTYSDLDKNPGIKAFVEAIRSRTSP